MRLFMTRGILFAWLGLLAGNLVAQSVGGAVGQGLRGGLCLAFVFWMFFQTRRIFRWSGETPIRQRLIGLGELGGLLLLTGIVLVILTVARPESAAEGQATRASFWIAFLGAVIVFLTGGLAVLLASLAVYEAGTFRKTWTALAALGLLVASWSLPIPGNNYALFFLAVIPFLAAPWRDELTGRFKALVFVIGFPSYLVTTLYLGQLTLEGGGQHLLTFLQSETGRLTTGLLRAVLILFFAQILVFQVKTLFSPVTRISPVRGGLRTKLFLFYLLAGAVPLVLMILILSVGFYIVLGGYRASLAKRLVAEYAESCLDSSRRLAADPEILRWAREAPVGPGEFGKDSTLSARLAEMLAEGRGCTGETGYLLVQVEADTTRRVGHTVGTPMARQAGYPFPSWAADTSRAGLVAAPDGVWARGVVGRVLGDRRLSVEVGAPLDRAFLERMKRISGVDFELNNGYWLQLTIADRQVTTSVTEDRGEAPAESRTVSTLPVSEGTGVGFLDRRLYFGGALLPEIDWATGRSLETVVGMLLVRTSLRNLYQVLLAPENTINIYLLVVVGILAGLLLVIMLVASGVGIRVVHNVTRSVGALKKGTLRVQAGDFDYRIRVTSRDEFEDLADSFNVMSAEIRRMLAAVKEKERLESELRIARSIQERLLPQSQPQLPGYEVWGSSVSAREVGGDYYDFLELGPERLGLVIGDVSGKGMTAALLMANLQASLRAFAREPSAIATVLGELNGHLHRTTSTEMYATFFYGILDARNGAFSYANAGHNPPVLVRSSGRVELLEKGGIPLGMLEGLPYEEGTVEIAPGDLLVLYTDGITEAENAEGEQMGEERFRAVAVSSRSGGARDAQERIRRAVGEFIRGHIQSDDLTLVTLKAVGPSS